MEVWPGHQHKQQSRGLTRLVEKYCEEYMAQQTKGDAGVPDRTVKYTVYIMSKTSWRALKLED